MPQVSRRIAPVVRRHVPDRAAHHADQLALRAWRDLQVQPAHHAAVGRPRVIVLHERAASLMPTAANSTIRAIMSGDNGPRALRRTRKATCWWLSASAAPTPRPGLACARCRWIPLSRRPPALEASGRRSYPNGLGSSCEEAVGRGCGSADAHFFTFLKRNRRVLLRRALSLSA